MLIDNFPKPPWNMPDLFPQLLIKSNCTHNTNFPNFGKLRRQIRCETNLSMLSKSPVRKRRRRGWKGKERKCQTWIWFKVVCFCLVFRRYIRNNWSIPYLSCLPPSSWFPLMLLCFASPHCSYLNHNLPSFGLRFVKLAEHFPSRDIWCMGTPQGFQGKKYSELVFHCLPLCRRTWTSLAVSQADPA